MEAREWRQGNDEPGPARGQVAVSDILVAGSDATRSTTPRDFFAAHFFANPPVWDPPPHDSSCAATPATANPRGSFSAAADPQPPIATRRSAFYRFAPMILPLDWLVPERQDDGGKMMTSPRAGQWTGDGGQWTVIFLPTSAVVFRRSTRGENKPPPQAVFLSSSAC